MYDRSIPDIVDEILLSVVTNKKSNRLISATGAHGLVHSQKDRRFADILESFYCNLPDGMPCVWIGKIKGAQMMERCYGPDFFKDLMIATSGKNINHFLCGGMEGVAESLKNECGIKFNNFNISGTFSPPFREMTDEELRDLASEINKKKSDIVWIGLSTPKQEVFAHRLAKYTNVHFLCTVGAAFDFHTGRVRQAPVVMQRMGLEWFFRLLVEPKRLWKRYIQIVPLFISYNFIEFLKGNPTKKE